jgi:hypothetical protein
MGWLGIKSRACAIMVGSSVWSPPDRPMMPEYYKLHKAKRTKLSCVSDQLIIIINLDSSFDRPAERPQIRWCTNFIDHDKVRPACTLKNIFLIFTLCSDRDYIVTQTLGCPYQRTLCYISIEPRWNCDMSRLWTTGCSFDLPMEGLIKLYRAEGP